MKPVAVTIGIGTHLKYAEKSAEYVRKYLGLETRIITDEHLSYCISSIESPKNIHSIKFSIFDIFPDIERVMYHDCDWRPVRQFDIMPYIPDPKELYFCLDRYEISHVQDLEKRYGLPPRSYFNSGWFVAHKEHQPILQHCKSNYFDYPSQYGDQCVFNQVIKDKLTLADRRLNVMDLFKVYHESEILGHHSSGNYYIYDGEYDLDWESTVVDRINLWDDSELWSTAKQHFVEIHETAKQYRGGNALEIGTFTGMGAMSIRLAGMNVKTLDITTKFLERCKHLWSPWNINFQKMSGQEELAQPEKYDLIFHDSEHGNHIIPELVQFFKTKLNPGGKLLVHDVNDLDLSLLLGELGNVGHTVTTDYRGRQLGTFWVA